MVIINVQVPVQCTCVLDYSIMMFIDEIGNYPWQIDPALDETGHVNAFSSLEVPFSRLWNDSRKLKAKCESVKCMSVVSVSEWNVCVCINITFPLFHYLKKKSFGNRCCTVENFPDYFAELHLHEEIQNFTAPKWLF